MMCHIRTQNTNKMLRAICQRQKGMVRAYLSMKNEMTLALQKINIFGYWPFLSLFTFLKISPSSSNVLHSIFVFCFSVEVRKNLFYPCLLLSVHDYQVFLFSYAFFFFGTMNVGLLDVRYSEVGFRLIRQDLILLVRCSSSPWLVLYQPFFFLHGQDCKFYKLRHPRTKSLETLGCLIPV